MIFNKKKAVELLQKFKSIDNANSKHTFYIEKHITKEILKSVHEYLNDIAGSITTGRTLKVAGDKEILDRSRLYIQNNNRFSLPFKIPYSDMVMIFDNEKNTLKLRIDKIPDGLKISYISLNNVEYLNFGEINISINHIEYISIDHDTDLNKITNCFMILGLFKFLLDKLLYKNIQYETRKATKQQKKREVNKVQSDFKFITLNYMSMTEIQTLFKYEKPLIAGSKKEPHNRRDFERTLKDGRKVQVKKAKVNGGADAVRFYDVR